MAKHKLKQFSEIETFPNVFHHIQYGKDIQDHPLKGNWNSDYFHSTASLVLELGCGKGEYTIGLGESFPNRNFMGIDLKGNRLWRGAKTALESGMKNVAFIRTRIENIHTIFGKNEVDEIWITFPDPQPGLKREKHRLTSPGMLQKYQQLLKPDGIIHLKTDNHELYTYTIDLLRDENCELLLNTEDLYSEPDGFTGADHGIISGIKTYYEHKFTALGFKIHYLRFRFKPQG